MTGLGANVMYSLEQQANRLKPGSEIVIKMTQKELNKNLQWKLKDGSFFEYDPKKKQVIIYKPKKKNYKCAEEALNSWFDVKDAVDACSDKITISTDIPGLDQKLAEAKKQMKQKEKQMKEKEKQMKQKEKQMKQKEKQMKQKEKIEYLSKLSLDFNKKIVYLLKNYKKLNRKEIIDKLDKSDKIISKYSVIWDEKERRNILEWLNVLKTIYRTDKEIKSKLEKIIKKVKESKLNSKIAS